MSQGDHGPMKILGAHPSGARICRVCGNEATLEAVDGPDWSRSRAIVYLTCQRCSVVLLAHSQRFHQTLTLRPIP